MHAIVKVIALPVIALSLTGCGEVMESTANLIDAVAENIENEDKDVIQEPVVQAEQQEEKVIPLQQTEPVQQATAEVKAPAPVKQTNIVETDNSGMTHVQVTAKDANVRAEPSLDSSVIVASKLNDVFTYLNEKVKTPDGRTWYKIETAKGIGYMSSAVGTLSTGTSVNTGTSTLTVRADEGNVRAKPSVNAKVIATVKGGDSLSYTGESISAADGRLWHEVIISGNVGYVSNLIAIDSEKYEKGDDGYDFVITSAEGNVRSEPSIDAPIIYTGKKNDQFRTYMETVDTPDGRTWYGVEVDGHGYGYISSKVGRVR